METKSLDTIFRNYSMDKIYYQTLEEFPHKKEIENSPLYYHINDLFHRSKRLFNKDAYDTLNKITKIENFDNYFKNCYGISLEKDGNPVLIGRNARIISNKVMVVEMNHFIPQSLITFRRGCPFKKPSFTFLFLLGSFYVYNKCFKDKV